MRLMMLFLVSSLISGCAGISKPAAYGCIVNAPAKNRKCYSFKTDFNDDGNLKPTAKPVYRSNETIEDLNKAFVLDSDTGFEDGLARVKTTIRDAREEYQRMQDEVNKARTCQ